MYPVLEQINRGFDALIKPSNNIKCGIYFVRNKINGKFIIGSTKNSKQRFEHYWSHLKKNH